MKILNRNNHILYGDDIYIGRPSKWRNPYEINKHGDNDEVILKFEHYFKNNDDLLNSLSELQNKNLVCWCSPLGCHWDIIKREYESQHP